MRKRLILIATIGLALLMALIIYNLWNSGARPQPAAPISPVLLDTANPADIAWFNDSNGARTAAAATVVNRHIPLSHPLPVPVQSFDQQAIDAPITSNQIHVEFTAQTEKSTEKSADNHVINAIHHPTSPYEIKTGSIIPAVLISGINSDLPGPITAQVRENVYDSISGHYLLIPQGTKLEGSYNSAIAYGQQRVLIAWRRLIFPNGQSVELTDAPGVDVSGYAGFKDQINNHYGRVFGSALLMSIMSAGLQLSQPQSSNNNNGQPSVNQTLAQNIGISLSQTADQLLQKNLNVQPTLEIRPGYLFNVSVTQDLIFPGSYR